MTVRGKKEVVVVGSGPNGLAAAIEMAANGYPVTVMEGASRIGGGTRSVELTLPGYLHDVCAAVHPLGASSPFFGRLPLARHGLSWITPPAALAHPLDDGTAVVLERTTAETALTLDRCDREAYPRVMDPMVRNWPELVQDLLAPVHVPAHPLLMARFGLQAVRSAESFARENFRGERARALFCGQAAHAFLPLGSPGTAAFGLILSTLGHVTGWPVAAGGSGRIAEALSSHFQTLGGKIITGQWVRTVAELPAEAIIIVDVTPRQLLALAGERLPEKYRKKLGTYRYGPGVFKVDWALSEPIPWRAPECRRAATVHLGGTFEEIAAGEGEVSGGRHPGRPFVLLAQQSLFDPQRAPEGRHTGWAYCHVPNGSRVDMTAAIEKQVERFAPGFRDIILARQARNTAALESVNPNHVGGDINGGVQDLRQMFARPVSLVSPYTTPDSSIFICSSSTPPGGGVHGMCGYHAARAALKVWH